MKIDLQERKIISGLLVVLFLSTALTINGCKESITAPESTEKIKTGGYTDFGSFQIGSGGGSVVISKAGAPIDGLKITIPSGAYSSSQTFTVSYAPITTNNVGPNFHPISPLIKISNDGGYADKVISVRVPVTIPKGSFAMGFFYNELTGSVEGLPVLSEDSVSVTVGTRHFETSSISESGTHAKGNHVLDATSFGNLIIASIEESRLAQSNIISTGFKPGVDDWEFINYGSFLAPGGHCAGQSMSAMWYFYEQKLRGAKQLFGLLDKVNLSSDVLWQDNRLGYKFASTAQCNLNWDGSLRKILMAERTYAPTLVWKSFALSMLVTGEPQYVGIRNSTTGAGHAIVAYKIDYTGGKLYVADPNFPGRTDREIDFTGSVFQPYMSGDNASDLGHPYNEIGYFAKTAFIDWDKLGQLWNNVQNKVIGAGKFPTYKLWVTNGNFEMPDTLITEVDSIVFTIKDADWSNMTGMSLACLDLSGTTIGNKGVVKLRPGDNWVGVYITGKPIADCEGSAQTNPSLEWLDFRWVLVKFNSLLIDPDSMSGQKGVSYTWHASAGSIPAQAQYSWDWGDGSALTLKTNDGAASHTYENDGLYTITLTLKDLSTNKVIGKTTAIAKIGAIWDIIHRQNAMTVLWQSNRRYSDGSTTTSETWNIPEAGQMPITWKDSIVQGFVVVVSPIGVKSYDSTTYSVSGNLAADGITINTLTVYERQMRVVYSIGGNFLNSDEKIIQYTIKNMRGVDMTTYNMPPYFQTSYDGVQPLLSKISSHSRHIEYDPITKETTTRDRDYVSTDWTGDNFLAVAFYVK